MNAKDTSTRGTHTPGPWTVGHPNLREDTWFHRIFYADNRGMYEVAVVDKRKRPGADYDASLIAAAPELLAALEWFADELPSIIQQSCPQGVPMDVVRAHEVAKSAIAKARGAV